MAAAKNLDRTLTSAASVNRFSRITVVSGAGIVNRENGRAAILGFAIHSLAIQLPGGPPERQVNP